MAIESTTRHRVSTAQHSAIRHAAAVAAMLVATLAAGCGVSDPPPGHIATSVPPQAVNDGTVGLVRIRLTQEVESQGASAFGKWLADHGMESAKATYLANELRTLGLTTILIGIPGDERQLHDAGLYLGGPETVDRDAIEDALIKTGGFSLLGGAASSLTVVPLTHGWHYVGLSGDGVIEDASDSVAAEYSMILAKIEDRPAAIVFPVGEMNLEDCLSQITFDGQARLVRRMRATTQALDEAIAIAGTISRGGRGEAVILFPDADRAKALGTAIDRIRKDMELALQGSIEQHEITAEEAEADRRMIARMRADVRGDTVMLYQE
jgi:hypothetical protein